MALTRRQQEIYDLLCTWQGDAACPPTLDDLCRRLGLKSRGSLHKHIQALVRAGLVWPMQRRKRGVRLVERVPEESGLPLLGHIAAGRPIESLAQQERIEVPALLHRERGCYVLRVRGDSMAEAGILDGDYVVVEGRSHARNGEIVVALVHGSEATLKRIEQVPGRVWLRPASHDHESLDLDPEDVEIQGVVVGLMRAYR
jgi:repressor LexA